MSNYVIEGNGTIDCYHKDKSCQYLAEDRTIKAVEDKYVEWKGLDPCSACAGGTYKNIGKGVERTCEKCGESFTSYANHLPCDPQ